MLYHIYFTSRVCVLMRVMYLECMQSFDASFSAVPDGFVYRRRLAGRLAALAFSPKAVHKLLDERHSFCSLSLPLFTTLCSFIYISSLLVCHQHHSNHPQPSTPPPRLIFQHRHTRFSSFGFETNSGDHAILVSKTPSLFDNFL